MEGGMPPGMMGAPPIGPYSWALDGPTASSESSAESYDTGHGMGDAMNELPYELTSDFWVQSTESSSWSPVDDGSGVDSDSDSSHSWSEAAMITGGQRANLFDMDFGGSTSPSSDHDGSNATSSTGDDGWPGLSDGWLSMEPTDTASSRSSESYSTVKPPVVLQVVHAQPVAADIDSWGVGAAMMANPAVQPKRGHPSLSSGSVSAKRPRAGVAAPVVSEPSLLPAPEHPTPVPGGSMAAGQTLQLEEVLNLLDHGIMVPRPSHLQHFTGSCQQVFLERPAQKRKKGDDKWEGSGGRAGSTEYWMGEVGVRKRYGRVTRDAPGTLPLKYAHYTRLRRPGGAASAAEEDKSVALFVVSSPPGPKAQPPARVHEAGEAAGAFIPLPVSGGRAPSAGASRQGTSSATGMHISAAASGFMASNAASWPLMPQLERTQALPARVVPAPHVFTATDDLSAALTVSAGVAGRFISFRDAGGVGSDKDLELGAFVREGNGVKLVSTQGDFAEWHRRKEGEEPFESGDVVGFHNGVISRAIHPRATMLGVVSRMAVVEGSLPAEDVRHLYDTVAYTGVVPVKLSMHPPPKAEDFHTGAVLRPSGYNDGTAILVPREKLVKEAEQRGSYVGPAAGRVGLLLGTADGGTELVTSPVVHGVRGGYKLVTAVVVNPTETVPLPRACCDIWLQRLGDFLWALIAMVAVMLVLLSLRSLGWVNLATVLS